MIYTAIQFNKKLIRVEQFELEKPLNNFLFDSNQGNTNKSMGGEAVSFGHGQLKITRVILTHTIVSIESQAINYLPKSNYSNKMLHGL